MNTQFRANGIIVDVIPLGLKGICIYNPRLGKSLLPDWRMEPEFPPCAKREAAFHKLDCALDSHAGIDREQQVEMIGHHHEGVQQELSRDTIMVECIDKQSGRAFRLEN